MNGRPPTVADARGQAGYMSAYAVHPEGTRLMGMRGAREDGSSLGKPLMIAGCLVLLVVTGIVLVVIKNNSVQASQAYDASAVGASWPAQEPSWQAASPGAGFNSASAGTASWPSPTPLWLAPTPSDSYADAGDTGYGDIRAQDIVAPEPSPAPAPTPAPLPAWPFPSMFCWMYISSPAEKDLTKEIAKKNLGIFACDEHGVYSTQYADFGDGKTTSKPLVDNTGSAQTCKTKANTVCNARLFVRVWNAVEQDGRYKRHPWTVKVDADSVFFPDRLRPSLRSHTGRPGAVMPLSCWNTTSLGAVWFLGPLEVVSRELISIYFERKKVCLDGVDYETGEDFWMQTCFNTLGVKFDIINLDWMLSDNSHAVSWMPPDPCAYQKCNSKYPKVVYHHYKNASAWLTCHDQAVKVPDWAA